MMTWLLLWTDWHLKEDIKHSLSMSWWKRFLDMTARRVWGNRTSISSCLGGALKNTQRAGQFVPQQPRWHSNKTISKPINHRCGMQRKTNTKTWNDFCAAVSCFKEKTLQHFRLFLPDVFQLLSLFSRTVDDKKELEMRSKRGQWLICWIANHPYKECVQKKKDISFLSLRWALYLPLSCLSPKAHFKIHLHYKMWMLIEFSRSTQAEEDCREDTV